MKTIAIANGKGGVGKTTTTHALGVALSTEYQYNTLLIDADPQASLTSACGLTEFNYTLADLLDDTNPEKNLPKEAIYPIEENIFIVPADISLASAEQGLTTRMVGRENALKKALQTIEHDAYDVVLIDCPPSLGMLTINSLTACDAVLIPTLPQAVDLKGLSAFLDTLDVIKETTNQDIEMLGILVTFFDGRLNAHKEVLEVIEEVGWKVLDVKIGRTIRISEASALGETVLTYAPENPQSDSYKQLAKVVNQWLENTKML